MRTAVKLVTMMNNLLVPMSARIPATQPANLIAYWKLGETSGTTADDSSATGADGVYSGTYTLGQTGIGDGSLSTLFTPTTGRVSLAATIATLDTPFDGAEGTLFAWAKVNAAGVWSDGASRFIASLGFNASNRIFLNKTQFANLATGTYVAGGTTEQITISTSTTAWFSIAVTWKKAAEEVKCYFNGAQNGATAGTLGVWTGALASGSSAIGDSTSAGGVGWSGNIAHVAAWKVALTAAEIASIGIL